MKIRTSPLKQAARAIAVAGLLAPLVAPHAASAANRMPPEVDALRRENADLVRKNKDLESRVRALEATREGAPEEAPRQAPTLRGASAGDAQFNFLGLGQGSDHMRAERYRIVDQIRQAIPPLYEPARPLHGYVLPPGATRLEFNLGAAHNPGNFGRDKRYAEFFDNVSVDTVTAGLQIMHGFEAFGVKDLMVNLNIPFKFVRNSGTGHPWRIDSMQMTMEGAGGGLGDIDLTVKKKWLDQGNGPLSLSTMLGVILPTGRDEAMFNASQTVTTMGMPMAVTALDPMAPSINVFGRTPTDRFFPRSAQPGQGSRGGRIGVGATHQFERGALHAGLIYDFFAKNRGITPGNELRYGLSYVTPVLESDTLSLDLALAGKYKRDEKFPGMIMHPERDPATGGPLMDGAGNMLMFMTPPPDFRHGNIVFFSPSLSYIPTPGFRFTASPAVRVFEPKQGPSPAWTVDLTVQHTF